MPANKAALPSKTVIFSSSKPGPTVVLIGGIHGDELTGIKVMRELNVLLKKGVVKIKSGRLIIVSKGSPKAVASGTRGSKQGADLNRCFRDDVLFGKNQTYEVKRARELAPVLSVADICLDLHSTRKPSEPFVTWGAAKLTAQRRALCQWFAVSKILLDPKLVMTGPGGGCTDDFVNRHGGIGLCYETGLASDTSRAKIVLAEVINFLRFLKIIEGSAEPARGRKAQLFEFTKAMILDERGFTYKKGMGTRSFQPVRRGAEIGSHGRQVLVAKENSVIVFPKTTDLWHIGKPVGFLARRVE